ncbi:MAG: DUF4440 domain-containing protein [Gammaproteobacteria bacterium]|nr:MAG: DUF4440 domain-containing protein [Gammaproteobacteria bacterium]RLA12942.1 MAG: DUF4440 domain-containing protein [Gammaproteobacteria bacterium]RLA13003.1 MAG: DUF4440 domain-containing protein [Gammaproteobacteria bacterium]
MAFETAIAAHEAFYQALGNADVELMTQVWKPVDDSVCIHPLWPPLIGHRDIFAAWKGMFQASPSMTVETEIICEQSTAHGCLHLVNETLISALGQTSSPVVATNAYELTDNGWQMVLHHASPTAVESSDHANQPLH